MSRVTEIAVAVVSQHNAILIGPRRDTAGVESRWEFPGGKIEPNESPELAAARECLEETGIAIDVGRRYAVVEHDYPTVRVRLHFFACTPLDDLGHSATSTAAPPREPFRWVDRASLDEYSFLAANAEILRILKAELE